jgi:uncharacterized membrane protein
MVRLLLPLALFTGGIAGGTLVWSAIAGAPLLLSLPDERYVAVHQFFVARFDPLQPVCLLTALACDLGLAFANPGAGSRALAGACAAVYAAVVFVSLTRNVPVNKWIAGLDPARLPHDWPSIDPRRRWRDWNLVRTTLATVALAGNVAMVAVLV